MGQQDISLVTFIWSLLLFSTATLVLPVAATRTSILPGCVGPVCWILPIKENILQLQPASHLGDARVTARLISVTKVMRPVPISGVQAKKDLFTQALKRQTNNK